MLQVATFCGSALQHACKLHAYIPTPQRSRRLTSWAPDTIPCAFSGAPISLCCCIPVALLRHSLTKRILTIHILLYALPIHSTPCGRTNWYLPSCDLYAISCAADSGTTGRLGEHVHYRVPSDGTWTAYSADGSGRLLGGRHRGAFMPSSGTQRRCAGQTLRSVVPLAYYRCLARVVSFPRACIFKGRLIAFCARRAVAPTGPPRLSTPTPLT